MCSFLLIIFVFTSVTIAIIGSLFFACRFFVINKFLLTTKREVNLSHCASVVMLELANNDSIRISWETKEIASCRRANRAES